MRNARLDELQAANKISRRNFNNFRYVDDTSLMAENEEELKSLLMRVQKENERAGLNLNIKKKKHNENITKLELWHLIPFLHGKKKGER